MRKPYRERVAEKEKREWEEIQKERKSLRRLACFSAFLALVIVPLCSWMAWDGSAFRFDPLVYISLLCALPFLGAGSLAFFGEESVFSTLREVYEIREKLKEFKAGNPGRGADGGHKQNAEFGWSTNKNRIRRDGPEKLD
jgi:hypothetical protein